MRVPLSWLREYVDIPVRPAELAHLLTMAGVEVGGLEMVGGQWDHIYVGRVTRVEPHPNADRLRLATVDIGSETLTAVCGAPNVAAGQRVPFAKVGASLFNTHTGRMEVLKSTRIRGVDSPGMVCSERELGLGEDHSGIVVLPQDAPVGMPLQEYLGDAVLELEVTPNRPDCLSVLGVAHEVAALTGGRVREPELSYPEAGEPIEYLTSVQVADPDLCPRYTASLVTGITVGPSPRWMQERLGRAGMRPINNVVDITNYVMLEYGQPLHAFDLHHLREHRIVVRRAQAGESLQTLDGEARRLGREMLVIADAVRPVGLAGVMGGANTEVTEGTTAVLLESANFNALNNRRTTSALRLRTEASLRFEKRLQPEMAERGLRRATQLLVQLCNGTAARSIIDVWDTPRTSPSLALRLETVQRVLGAELSKEQVQAVLDSLGFRTERHQEGKLTVHIPYWRSDISIEEDLVEEVARVVGYDQLPTKPLAGPVPYYQRQPERELQERVRNVLVSLEMQEVITHSAVSRELLEWAEALEGASRPLALANPMSREQEYLRTTLRGSLLQTAAYNLNRGQEGLRLFELGRVYLPRDQDLPHEKEMAAGLLCGPRADLSWLERPSEADFFDAKGVLETLLQELGVSASFEPHEVSFMLAGRCARLTSNGTPLGLVGEVHLRVLERFDIQAPRVALFELDLEALLPLVPAAARRYQPLPRFPDVLRDMALVVDEEVLAARVEAVLRGHPLVAQVTLFDAYTGPPVSAGKRSLAYRVLFRSPGRTLTAEEVAQAQEALLAILRRTMGAQLRT